MAKNAQFQKATVETLGVVRIDGEVIAVTDAGVTIHTRAMGRRTMVDRFIPMSDIVCYTNVGPGYVVAHSRHLVAEIAGQVVSEDGVVSIQDGEGTIVNFSGAYVPSVSLYFTSIEEDDRAINRSSVLSAVKRKASSETRVAGNKKSKKEKPASVGRRRKA